ncbi:Ig-like domain-containing protein [Frankia nepalensis]|uniref:Ig-like domain-containing protein n=1 Tax=Frankia nepalensis TaxID=1836974 RepID=UPI0027DEAB12|nr:Ig-like domain-containing protein [Frankia nepalensis]
MSDDPAGPAPDPTSEPRRPGGRDGWRGLGARLAALLDSRPRKAAAAVAVLLVVALLAVLVFGGGEDDDPAVGAGADGGLASGAPTQPAATASSKPLGKWTLVVGDRPLDGMTVAVGVEVSLVAGTASLDGVERVRFSLDGDTVLSDRDAPFAVRLDQLSDGDHVLSARVRVDDDAASDGAEPTSGTGGSDGSGNPDVIEAEFRVGEGTGGTVPSQAPAVAPPPAAVTSVPPAPAPLRTINVSTSDELSAALSAARPGDLIQLADGVYEGNFVGNKPGTAAAPVTVRGSRGAVIDGGDVDNGYVFHLDGANYWRLEGFTIRNGEKGLMADKTNHAVIHKLTVTQVGHEAVHLRNFSSDNLVAGVTVNGTGRTNEGYGEAIYVGTAESNWDRFSGGRVDNSDRNQIIGNTLSGFTAEGVDIKEGTTGGVVAGNSFDGSGITGDNYADSWIDLKGNGWRIEKNSGVNSPLDGIQTHVVVDGWGTGNVISGNTLNVGGSGYGVNIHKPDDTNNVVSCSNVVTNAGSGPYNVDCS